MKVGYSHEDKGSSQYICIRENACLNSAKVKEACSIFSKHKTTKGQSTYATKFSLKSGFDWGTS